MCVANESAWSNASQTTRERPSRLLVRLGQSEYRNGRALRETRNTAIVIIIIIINDRMCGGAISARRYACLYGGTPAQSTSRSLGVGIYSEFGAFFSRSSQDSVLCPLHSLTSTDEAEEKKVN